MQQEEEGYEFFLYCIIIAVTYRRGKQTINSKERNVFWDWREDKL